MIISSLVGAVSVCAASAALEGACAGTGVQAVFATMRAPKYSATLPVWFAIGGMYYVTFGFVLYRLLSLSPSGTFVHITIALVVAMMIANALWNLIFFRARNLYLAFITGSAAPLLDIPLAICLYRLDVTAALWLTPYLLYRVYAMWWGWALWRLNRPL